MNLMPLFSRNTDAILKLGVCNFRISLYPKAEVLEPTWICLQASVEVTIKIEITQDFTCLYFTDLKSASVLVCVYVPLFELQFKW